MSDSKSILVIEDDAILREMVVNMLAGAGYRVIEAQDGEEGLEQVALEMPDLILLDMRMPRMSGWEFAFAFRKQYDHPCPIVVMSGDRDAGERAGEISADDFLDKPFKLTSLLRLVTRHLPPDGAG